MLNNLFFFIMSTCIFFTCSIIGLFQNPIYSVLCLLLIILLVSILFISLHLQYLALTLVIIYGGAIIILFLFIIITVMKNLNVSFAYKLCWPNNLLAFLFLFIHILFAFIINNKNFLFTNKEYDPLQYFLYKLKYGSNDMIIFSDTLFTEYFIILLFIIFILLFSLISAIFIAKKFVPSTNKLENYIKNN